MIFEYFLNKWGKTNFVRATKDIETKGWLFDISLCIDQLNKREFSLAEVYAFESVLKAKHPANNNIKATVKTSVYMGTHTQLQLDLAGQPWRAQGPADYIAQPGDTISVHLPERRIWLLPPESV